MIRSRDMRMMPTAVSEDNWFVVSYEKDGTIYYRKQYVGAGSYCCLEFEYPSSASVEADALAEEIVPTFQPGDLSVAP